MRRNVVLAVLACLIAAFGLTLIGRAIDPGDPVGLDKVELSDMRSGGWRAAIAPHSSIPIPPESAAAEVARRLAIAYCDDDSVEEVHFDDTESAYHFFVPGCLEIEEPENRLEEADAQIEVHVGVLPILSAPGVAHCKVNAGAQYEDHGLCVRDLLKGAGVEDL